MKIKKHISLILSAALTLSLMGGCDASESASDKKEKVTVAMWSDQLTENYAGYLQKEFPDVEFEFYGANNSSDFFRFKTERGDLPDIITLRRFSLKDVYEWRDSLMDLSNSELANMFYEPYLRNYTYSDGVMNWLPACAEVDGTLMNKALFDELGIDIPTNYEEFAAVCGELKAQGIRPFRSDFDADYTCMEILQGLSVSALTSHEGREWRQKYESGQTDRLSEEVWLPVFQRMLDFIDYTDATPDDYGEYKYTDVFDSYRERRVAMIRGTADEALIHGVEDGTLLMPYFGDTSDDNWYLTYPAFQVAASASAEKSPERKELILNIMTAMLNENGLRNITSGRDMISYTKNAELEFSPILSYVKPNIEKNQLYIRLASSEMFSVSKEIVQKMIAGEYPDAISAFNAFNAAMSVQGEDEAVIAHIDKGYSYEFDPNTGSPAASAIMNTVREEIGSQLLVAQSINVAGNISAGDYTKSELRFLTMGETVSILLCDMTAQQLAAYLDYVHNTGDKRGSVANASSMYVASGFEMEIRKTDDGYKVEKLTVNGEEMKPDKTYSVAVIGNENFMQREALGAAGITDYEKSDAAYREIVTDRLEGGGQLALPTNYIMLK